jgi:FKBP-type peptidyl-prolyl cis-trans isomerase
MGLPFSFVVRRPRAFVADAEPLRALNQPAMADEPAHSHHEHGHDGQACSHEHGHAAEKEEHEKDEHSHAEKEEHAHSHGGEPCQGHHGHDSHEHAEHGHGHAQPAAKAPLEGVPGTDVSQAQDGGLFKQVLREGDAASGCPPVGAKVKVHYVGTLADGTKFDSSRDRPGFFEFDVGVNSVIKGWDEGICTMKKVRLRLRTMSAPPHVFIRRICFNPYMPYCR